MRYLLLIHVTNDEPLSQRGMEAHRAVQAELKASGELIDTSELAEGRLVRRTSGELVVTDGPYTETAEIIGGYYLVDCVDIDRATEIAGRFVEAEFAPIEVRRIP